MARLRPKDALFAFGSNGSAQLGLGHSNDTARPEHSPVSLHSIRKVAAGGNHTLILGDDGVIESRGNNSHNQCSPISGMYRISHVSTTWTVSILLSADGTVFACGEGLSGELGLGVGTTYAAQPRAIPNFPLPGTDIVQIASSMAHAVAVLSNGEVWGWGKGRQGQLGEPAETVWSPRQIRGLPFPVKRAVCGKDFTCVLGERNKGRMHILGLQQRDRFGLLASMPLVVPGWKDVAASWGSIYVLRDDGELLGIGRDDHGQLPPPGLPPVQAIAAGSEHCIALTKAGKVLAWGWGEHGNCGEPTDARGDVKGHWNEIDMPGSVRAVFAGCATSFVVAAAQHEQDGGQG